MGTYQVFEQIDKIREELKSLHDELDTIDCTHYGKYSSTLQKIAEKTSKLQLLEKLGRKTQRENQRAV